MTSTQVFQIMVDTEDSYVVARLAPPQGQVADEPGTVLASVHRAGMEHEEVAHAFEKLLRLLGTALVQDVAGKEVADTAQHVRVEGKGE